jgi:uncharacterized protein DUF1579
MSKASSLAVTVVMTAVVFCLVTVVAQEKKGDTKPAGGENGFPMAKPGPEMEKLNFQLGTWTTQEKHEPMMGFNGGEGKGVINVKAGPGGLSLVTDYKSVGPMGNFTGFGVAFWDAEEKVYKSYWLDNSTAGSMNTTGRWEGKELIFTGEMKMQGQSYSLKEVYTDITPTSYTMQMFMNEGSGPLKLAFTLKAKKK